MPFPRCDLTCIIMQIGIPHKGYCMLGAQATVSPQNPQPACRETGGWRYVCSVYIHWGQVWSLSGAELQLPSSVPMAPPQSELRDRLITEAMDGASVVGYSLTMDVGGRSSSQGFLAGHLRTSSITSLTVIGTNSERQCCPSLVSNAGRGSAIWESRSALL